MPNYLWNFGLGFLEEEEDTKMGLLAHTLRDGIPITGYYGLPYFNLQIGDPQMIARTKRNHDGDLECSGFDTHCKGGCAWELRIIGDLSHNDDDPLVRRLFLKGEDGSGFIADVVNSDVLPSFSHNEKIKAQMVAFPRHVDFYESEEEYDKTVVPTLNNSRFRIGEDMLFPVGLFKDDDDPEIKDLVHIHGTIEKAFWGDLVFDENEEKMHPFIFCRVRTQYGNLDVIINEETIDQDTKKHIHSGAIADCIAYLSADAAIYEYEQGIVKDHTNNLKLVAYTFERGDPERVRSVAADDFVYHSEVSGKHIDGVEEYIEHVNRVHRDGEPCYAYYATIINYAEGEEPEFPIGTRCLVLKYDSEENFNSIGFVEENENGEIRRILLTRNSKYRFAVDLPPEEERMDTSGVSLEDAFISRAHIYHLISSEADEDTVHKMLSDEDAFISLEVEKILSEQTGEQANTEDMFYSAYATGVSHSNVPGLSSEEIRSVCQQLNNEYLHHKATEDAESQLREALSFVMAMGMLYRGRVGEQNE